ncbi:MAG TPA: metallopeptidase TldD-related protein [Candidatus Acidoferrum sp.]|nr:metallopeptidase TldD-related protein [Candidatus Acidoferrum sp.]
MKSHRIAILPRILIGGALSSMIFAAGVLAQQWPAPDADQTLKAMHDELERSRARLTMPDSGKPYFIQYRLVDFDIRVITAQFGALVSSTTTHNRVMDVGVRMGDYQLDSSNFFSGSGFQGFLGSAGQVGVDGDYNSLRQDLWLATDQAYKEAISSMGQKQGFLRSLSRPPEVADFSKENPLDKVEPRVSPDWTNRNWEQEAKDASAVLRSIPELYTGQVKYTLIYETYYVMNTEGTQLRKSRTLAAIEASMETQAPDGVPMHNFYAAYAPVPAGLPASAEVAKQLENRALQLMVMRKADPMPAYSGPVLFEPRAAASLLTQMLAASISGSRTVLSPIAAVEAEMEALGGRSEWAGRVGGRVLPADASLVDDPGATNAQGQPLIGSYTIDDEAVPAQRVSIVEAGMLRNFLMSRRPGSDFKQSNGHGRNVFLGDPHTTSSNLFFRSSNGLSSADLKKKFLDECKKDGRQWCLLVREMDNPAVGNSRRDEYRDALQGMIEGLSGGERVPLVVYRVNVEDGSEDLLRPGHLQGLNLRALRDAIGIGTDATLFAYAQSQEEGFADTALAPFGTAESCVPSTITAPSILFEDVEGREARGEMRKQPLVPPPPMSPRQ